MNTSKKNSIMITGASGFIGGNLMKSYRDEEQSVIGVDLKSNANDILETDLRNPEKLKEPMKQCDVIIHTAAMVSNAMSDEEMWKTNVLNTSKLIKLAVECGIKRFVHISSIVVYGNSAIGEINEDTPVNSSGGNYVQTKILSEHALLQETLTADIELIIIRPGDVYGPGSRPWIIEPIKAIKSKQFMLPAMGKGFFRPVFIGDLVEGVKLATASNNASGETFNLSCEGYITTQQYFSYHYKWLGRGKPMTVPTPVALFLSTITTLIFNFFGKLNEASPATVDQLSTKSWYSIQKARDLLGWEPKVKLDEGMAISEKWARNQKLI